MTWRSLPSPGSAGLRSPGSAVLWSAPIPCRPSRHTSFPSRDGYHPSRLSSVSGQVRRRLGGREAFLYGPSPAASSSEMETTGRPKFLGNPDVPTPCSQTPATRPGHTAGRHGSTRIVRRELSTRGNFGAQSHGIGTSCLRFAVRLTPPHARLASGCRPSSTRRDWLPVGFLRKVSVMLLTSLSPFPSFLAQTMSPFSSSPLLSTQTATFRSIISF